MTPNPKRKFKIVVDDQSYSVEIMETSETTLDVVVDGHNYKVEIHPENPPRIDLGTKPTPEQAIQPPRVVAADNGSEILSGDLSAPLPGNLTEIYVKVGDRVEAGQALCVIEAMKMKNVLRSPRSGEIAAVDVSLGETVSYNQTLIRFR